MWQTHAPGITPDFRIKTLPSGAIPLTQMIGDVAARYPGRLMGDLSGIAHGNADLLDAAFPYCGMPFSIRTTFNRLAFSIEEASLEVQTGCWFLERLSASMGPTTGALVWRGDPLVPLERRFGAAGDRIRLPDPAPPATPLLVFIQNYRE